jgi:large subunit ribosomal protein L43
MIMGSTQVRCAEYLLVSSAVNDRTKVIGLKKLTKCEIMDKIQLLLDSSGAKIKPLKGQSVQSTTPSTRGIAIRSDMHVKEPFKV